MTPTTNGESNRSVSILFLGLSFVACPSNQEPVVTDSNNSFSDASLTAVTLPEYRSSLSKESNILTTDKIHIIFRAFIPNHHPGNPGYIRKVPGRPDKFMIDPPLSSWPIFIRKIIGTDGCFMTDHRDFSDDPAAQSRLTTEFRLVINGHNSVVEPIPGKAFQWAGATEKVNCNTGETMELGTAIPHTAVFREPFRVAGPFVNGDDIQITFQNAASNPLAFPSPDVDYSLDMIYNIRTKKLSYKATVGAFPAFEAYARMNNDATVELFKLMPTGDTAWSLLDVRGQRYHSGTASLGTPGPQRPEDLVGKWTGQCLWSIVPNARIKDPVTLLLENAGHGLGGIHTSLLNGAASSLQEIDLDLKNGKIQFVIFGWPYKGTVGMVRGKLTIRAEYDKLVVCTYVKE